MQLPNRAMQTDEALPRFARSSQLIARAFGQTPCYQPAKAPVLRDNPSAYGGHYSGGHRRARGGGFSMKGAYTALDDFILTLAPARDRESASFRPPALIRRRTSAGSTAFQPESIRTSGAYSRRETTTSTTTGTITPSGSSTASTCQTRVLNKVYYRNALRITAGLPQAGWPR